MRHSDHNYEYSFAHRVRQTGHCLFDFEVLQRVTHRYVHLMSLSFAITFLHFSKDIASGNIRIVYEFYGTLCIK